MAENHDVVPSGRALQQAAAWLGISDPAKVLNEDPAAEAFQPRPEGLGLGAKFLPHHKAAQLTMPLEKRFGKRLQRTTADDTEPPAAAPVQKRGRPVGKYQAQDSKHLSSDSSEEEEVGRSGVFGRKKVLPNQAHAIAQRQQTQKKKGKKQKAGDNQAAAVT